MENGGTWKPIIEKKVRSRRKKNAEDKEGEKH